VTARVGKEVSLKKREGSAEAETKNHLKGKEVTFEAVCERHGQRTHVSLSNSHFKEHELVLVGFHTGHGGGIGNNAK